MLVGKAASGNFACIPVLNAGCHLANLKDKFWNSEHLPSSNTPALRNLPIYLSKLLTDYSYTRGKSTN